MRCQWSKTKICIQEALEWNVPILAVSLGDIGSTIPPALRNSASYPQISQPYLLNKHGGEDTMPSLYINFYQIVS